MFISREDKRSGLKAPHGLLVPSAVTGRIRRFSERRRARSYSRGILNPQLVMAVVRHYFTHRSNLAGLLRVSGAGFKERTKGEIHQAQRGRFDACRRGRDAGIRSASPCRAGSAARRTVFILFRFADVLLLDCSCVFSGCGLPADRVRRQSGVGRHRLDIRRAVDTAFHHIHNHRLDPLGGALATELASARRQSIFQLYHLVTFTMKVL